jgi:hypothetical protein
MENKGNKSYEACRYEAAKSILTSELNRQKAELVEKVEGLNKPLINRTVPLTGPGHEMEVARTNSIRGYNAALYDAANIIKEHGV